MNDVTPGTSLDVALDYIKRGWSPVPVPHRKKGPVIEEWTGLRITVETAPGYFGRQPQNIGVLLEAACFQLLSGLQIIDVSQAEVGFFVALKEANGHAAVPIAGLKPLASLID